MTIWNVRNRDPEWMFFFSRQHTFSNGTLERAFTKRVCHNSGISSRIQLRGARSLRGIETMRGCASLWNVSAHYNKPAVMAAPCRTDARFAGPHMRFWRGIAILSSMKLIDYKIMKLLEICFFLLTLSV